jgi:hypothetical protein
MEEVNTVVAAEHINNAIPILETPIGLLML